MSYYKIEDKTLVRIVYKRIVKGTGEPSYITFSKFVDLAAYHEALDNTELVVDTREDMEYHGIISMYDEDSLEMKFTDGKLVRVRRLDKEQKKLVEIDF